MPNEYRLPKRKLMKVETEELIEELAARSGSLIIGMLSNSGDDAECFSVVFRGGRFACIGMVASIQHDLMNPPGKEPRGKKRA